MRLGSTPRSIRRAMRYVITRVLPEPAPASTSRGPSLCSTASRCGGLSCIERANASRRDRACRCATLRLASFRFANERAPARELVRFGGGLVAPLAGDARETHRNPRFVPRRQRDALEVQLEHARRLDAAHRSEALDGVAANPGIELENLLVRQSRVGLRDRRELAIRPD